MNRNARIVLALAGVLIALATVLGALGVLMRLGPPRLLGVAASMVIAGIVLFSGSLYALSFGAPRVLGLVTPFGGLLLIAGWLVFAVAMMLEAPQRE